jgi:catechol 2,3-dioxygenase-like lactoylglutathione lyase family enzyme
MVRNEYRIVGLLALLVVAFLAWEKSAAQSNKVNPLHLSTNHVTASVADLEREAEWYERVLGFRRSKLLGGRKDFGLYQMTMPGNRIDLVWEQGSSRHRQAEGRLEQGWLHVVFNTPDLNEAYQPICSTGKNKSHSRAPTPGLTAKRAAMPGVELRAGRAPCVLSRRRHSGQYLVAQEPQGLQSPSNPLLT